MDDGWLTILFVSDLLYAKSKQVENKMSYPQQSRHHSIYTGYSQRTILMCSRRYTKRYTEYRVE